MFCALRASCQLSTVNCQLSTVNRQLSSLISEKEKVCCHSSEVTLKKEEGREKREQGRGKKLATENLLMKFSRSPFNFGCISMQANIYVGAKHDRRK
ncbi:hypothetical protein [Microcoleus sp. PH2017_28_MFU_U_A]|uniref:hypothetical protein n=1 Tax=Microcoleus sp. PH2017_28_MFU_U_A TaxID=2798838 RepID=UPI001D65E1A2|nr:hypothetical protein [Microcoleus sp. PH2017_28_MFU_U_A]MCC3510235.1 hypothetical protein [Microcoleus sp. PH2017_17_BER_D_A]